MQKKLIIDTTRKKLDYKLGLSPITLLINIHLKQEFFQIISNIVKLFQFLKIKILFSNLTIMTLHQFYHHFLKVLKEQQSEQSKTLRAINYYQIANLVFIKIEIPPERLMNRNLALLVPWIDRYCFL